MNVPSTVSNRIWMIILVLALGFLIWTHFVQAQRALFVSRLAGDDAVEDVASPTGYAGGKRWLIQPDHNDRGYRWIMETQQMLASGQWQVRQIDFENAPAGHAVCAASPYRWWLSGVAWIDHRFSGRSLGLSVERAALWADPFLHALLLLGATVFAARQFGILAAVPLAIGLVVLVPFVDVYQSASPDSDGLALAIGLSSVLMLLAGLQAKRSTPSLAGKNSQNDRWFFLGAGILSGLGLWISVAHQGPILLGASLGGLCAAWWGRQEEGAVDSSAFSLWRIWALSGAVTSLAAYWFEYDSTHQENSLVANHPFYALALVGAGELITWVQAWTAREKTSGGWREAGVVAFALVALAATSAWIFITPAAGTNEENSLIQRLNDLERVLTIESAGSWLRRVDFSWEAAATCLPLLLIIPAIGLVIWKKSTTRHRALLGLALGPVAVAVVFALHDYTSFRLLAAMLLALMVAILADDLSGTRLRRSLCGGILVLLLLPGFIRVFQSTHTAAKQELTQLEAESLIERELAHWLSNRTGAGQGVILAPPFRTVSLCYHGGLRGIGTFNRDNRAGLAATVKIAGTSAVDEVQAAIQRQGITHLIIPSWDHLLDDLATLSHGSKSDLTLLSALREWALPSWSRPVSYQPPEIAGIGDQSVLIFEVVAEQDQASSLSRLVEYFVEMEQFDLAASAAEALGRFPTDIRTTIAQAQLESARGNHAGFATLLDSLKANIASGYVRTLSWNQRLSLAILLAQGKQKDLAREQLRKCLAEVDAARLRALSINTLYRLQILSRAYALEFPNPETKQLASQLLPPQVRQRLR